MTTRAWAGAAVVACAASSAVVAQDRDTKVRNDRRDVQALGTWIYNDLPAGIAKAKQSGRPMLVTLRCIP